MAASAVEMNSALPSPQPARKPMICPTVPDAPASVAKTTISASPASIVRFTPRRLEMKPVKNIATAVINR